MMAFRPVSEVGHTTVKYDEPEVENVTLGLCTLVTFLTSGSSYLNVALTTMYHLYNGDCLLCSFSINVSVLLHSCSCVIAYFQIFSCEHSHRHLDSRVYSQNVCA